MLTKSEGLVVKTINYGETSLIAHILTPLYGLHSFIVSGVRKKKNQGKIALYQPGQVLSLVFYQKKEKDIWRIKEASPALTYRNIYSNIHRSLILSYFLEIIRSTTWNQGHADERYFSVVKFFIERLDEIEVNQIAHMPIQFVWQVIDLLGLSPNREQNGNHFDLLNGVAISKAPEHLSYLNKDKTNLLFQFLNNSNKESMLNPSNPFNKFDREQRNYLLDIAHQYLLIHLPHFKMPTVPELYSELF